MKGKDIYTGTIKKCTNIYNYNKYGEEHFFEEFRAGHTVIGTTHKYVDIIDEKAVLIKVDESRYIVPNTIANKFDEFLLSLGICNSDTIGTTPCHDNQLFVDEETIKPLFKDDNEKISIKQVKSIARTFNTTKKD